MGFNALISEAVHDSDFVVVPPWVFARRLTFYWLRTRHGVFLADVLTPPHEHPTTEGFISRDGKTGCGIRPDGTITGMFNLGPRNRGRHALNYAVKLGGNKLDCFDPWLPSYYRAQGFVETRRERNWTPGGPDLVCMELAP